MPGHFDTKRLIEERKKFQNTLPRVFVAHGDFTIDGMKIDLNNDEGEFHMTAIVNGSEPLEITRAQAIRMIESIQPFINMTEE